ncbi:endolytic transglycosylase MltG, partial [Enterococcus faecium]|uniref:endolytic transglycosylase MltG n=1 Tax=Enterococcus faecium TaxID=1352 RepID=UPI003CC5C188
YDYYTSTSLKDLVIEMVNKTNSVMQNYYSAIKQKNLTVQEVLTLASLVEKEGVKENDRKNIAQVFFNRIKANLPHQS